MKRFGTILGAAGHRFKFYSSDHLSLNSTEKTANPVDYIVYNVTVFQLYLRQLFCTTFVKALVSEKQ